MSGIRSTKLERPSKKKKSADIAHNQTACDATDLTAKDKDKDMTTCRKEKDPLASVKTVQNDRRKSKIIVGDTSSHTIDKSIKPVYDGSRVEVCKSKGQTNQPHYSTGSNSQSLSSDSHSGNIYTIKLSGLRLNVKQSRIEKLIEPFGNFACVKILRYSDTRVCYAYVDYSQKTSAEKAVEELDKYELSGTKIHVCHKSDKHNCRQELEALNNPDNFTFQPDISGSDTIVEHHEVETKSFTQEIANQNPSVLSSTASSIIENPTSCEDEMSSNDTGYRQSSKIYSIKLSGFRMNIKESEIERLVRPFGDRNDPVYISQYRDTKISYALVNYKQKSSAEEAVFELDRIEFNNTKIHVCHQGELAVDHDCQNILYVMNAPQDSIDNLNTAAGGYDFLEILKAKSIKFINHLALSSELDFKNLLRSVTVLSHDHITDELSDECDTRNCVAIEVTNLHPNVWFQELENHFKSCGSPVSTCVRYYGYSSSAIISYTSTEIASNAIKLFDGSEFHERQIHVIKANHNNLKTRSSPVSKSHHTRAGKGGASKDPHVVMKMETKKEAGTTSKKKRISLEWYQVLVLIVCLPNLAEIIKASYKVVVTGFHEGSTSLYFKGDNFQMAYKYVMKHVELCKSKEFQCGNLASSLVAIAIKSIKKLGISVVMCNTDGEYLLSILETAKTVNIDVVVVHSLYVKEINHAIGVLQNSPHSKNLRLLSKDIKDQLKEVIKRFQKKYLVSLQVLEKVVLIQGYIEDDVIGIYEELEKVIEKLSQVTIEYNQEPREEMQFVRYRMFFKPTKQTEMLLNHLAESLSLKIQKTKRSFTLTGNPVATTEGIKCINHQLLKGFQVETFRCKCHPDFLQLIKESIKEPIEKEFDVVIYYFSVNGSEHIEPVKSILIYVKVYSTDSTDFRKACDIIHKLKPQSTFFSLAEDEFEYISDATEETVDLTRIGEPYRVMIVLQHEKVGVTLHAFTLKEAKHCYDALMQNILAALNLVNYIELTTIQMNYLCTNKSDVIKSLSLNFETSANLHPKLKLEGKRSQVEKNALKIQELLNRVVTRSHKVTYNNYITMWKKCWQDIKDKIVQDNDLYVELTASSFEGNVTFELVVVGEVVQKVESAISAVTKIDKKVRECNMFADLDGIEILRAGLACDKINVRKEIAYHIEIVQTDIIITTPYHMPIEEVKQTVEAYILLEKENQKIVRRTYEIKYLFFAKKLRSEWNVIQSFANNCKINLVIDSHCTIEVEGKKVEVERAKKQILMYISSLENLVKCSLLPVDSCCRSVLQSPELLHLCKELESESCLSLTLQMYPEVLLSAVVRKFDPSVTVQICEGNISLDRSNTFINFTDANLTISEELKTIIDVAAAVDSERYLKRYGPQPAGKAVWFNTPTDGQKVIHAVMPDWDNGSSGEINLIISALCESLELAVKHNAISVAFPFFSCIDKNIPVKFLAECCLLGVHNFCQRSNFIHRIRLILPTEMVKIFVNEFTTGIFQQFLVVNSEASSLPGDSIWLWKDDFGEYQCYESKEISMLDKECKTNPTCHLTIGRFTYKIDFSAMTQTNTSTQKIRSIQHVISDCKWMFKNTNNNWECFSLQDSLKVEIMYVKRNDFSMITAGEEYEIKFSSMTRVNTQTNVRTDIKRVRLMFISDENASDSKIVILGLGMHVEDASVKIRSCIDSLCLIKSVDIPQNLSRLSTHLKKIEKDHKVMIYPTASATVSKRYNVKGLKDNVQEAVVAVYRTIAENSTSQSSHIRPKDWEPQSSAVELMDVSRGSTEWNKILNLMQKTLPSVKLISIQRIQNENLWAQYCEHKERLRCKGSERVKEKELFHGTSDTPPEKIYKSEVGFDMRFSRAGMWGQGNYFAESARYSASGYSYQKKTTPTFSNLIPRLISRSVNEKQIFLAKVLIGDSYRSLPDQKLRIPPLKYTSPSEDIHYDTVNGNSNGDIIYITYSNDKAYPMYLITFTD